MSEADEENQLQNALEKLQSQIDQQKELVKKMLDLKQKRIKRETANLTQLKSLVHEQNRLEKREVKLQTENAKVTKPQPNGNSHHMKTPAVQPQPQFASNIKPTRFTKKILANRQAYYYKNRKFFHGYKFVLLNNDQKLCIVSTKHELSGKPLENANMLPVYISLNGKNYIKSAKGDYYLENLSKKAKQKGNQGKLKFDEPCIFYTKTGNCTNVNCQYQHIPGRIALCPTLQSTRHKCLNKVCHYSHEPTQFNSPSCIYFQENKCNNENCIFTHKKENKSAPICRQFACLGYCEEGLKCKFTHSFECPDLKEYGRCLRGQACTCLHNSNMLEFLNHPHINENNQPLREVRNKDNDKIVQIVYDDAKDFGENNDNSDSDSDDNVEFIVGPTSHGNINENINDLGRNSDYIKL